MLIAFIAAALSYGASSVMYGLARRDEAGDYQRARRVLAVSAFLHVGAIGGQCLTGVHPFVSVFQMISLAALLTVIGYLLVSMRRRNMPALGAVLAPVAMLALTVGTVAGADPQLRDYEFPRLILLHAASASIGVAAVGLAAGISGLYLALERRLRNKSFRPSSRPGLRGGGISLTSLESLHYNLMLFVVPVFSVALVSGAVVMMMSDTMTIWSDRPLEFIAAGLAWTASVMTLTSRVLWGVRGRRAAWLTLLAFLPTLGVLISYGVRA